MSFRDIRNVRASRQQRSLIVNNGELLTSVSERVKVPSSAISISEHGTSYNEQGNDSTKITLSQSTSASDSLITSIQKSNLTVSDQRRDGSTPISTVPCLKDSVSSPSTEAQAISSSLYAELPQFLTIKTSKLRGRGIWTKKDIKAGTTLFTVRAHVHVLSQPMVDSFCSACCSPDTITNLKKCTKCKVVYYCGTACQSADWIFHKFECEALRRWASASAIEHAENNILVAPEAIRCLSRMLWKKKKEGVDAIWWKEISEMYSHRSDPTQAMVDAHIKLAHGLVRYIGIDDRKGLEKYQLHGIADLVDLISKFTSNAFTLTTPSLTPIGVSVSPLAALLNHSCDPNVVVIFPRSPSTTSLEPVLHVVAIKDVPAGSELFTSYIDVTLPAAQRQKALQETYNFACTCPLCSASVDVSEGAEDWRERLWCPRNCGGTCRLPGIDDTVVFCSKCEAHVSDVERVVDMVRIGQEALDKSTSLQFSDPEQALRLTRNIIPMLVSVKLTPATHPLLALYRLQYSLLLSVTPLVNNTSQEHLDETIRSAAKVVAGYSIILHAGHPVRSLALAELGKLLAVDEPNTSGNTSTTTSSGSHADFPPTGPVRLRLAVETLKQALTELRIGFGREIEGGTTGVEVRKMLIDLEKELDVWRSRAKDAINDSLTAMQRK